MFNCPMCSKSFKTRQALNNHLTSHTKEKPHKCPTCLAAFTGIYILRRHIKVVHEGVKTPDEEKKWKCPTCSYKCTSRSTLEIHKRKHSSVRLFSCTIVGCDFTTKHKSALAPHVRGVHTFERPYECPSTGCSYKSSTKGNLEHHLAVHTNEKPFVCQFPGCNRAYKNRFKLKFHIRNIHSEDKSFKCSKCDFRTSYKFILRQHDNKHEKSKRFHCKATNCSYSTTTTQLLRSHFDAKHVKKTVKCERQGCNFRCGTNELLNIHTQNAHVRPILKCPVAQCIFSSRCPKDVGIHVRRQHPEAWSALVSGQLKLQAAGPVDFLMCSFPKCNYQTEFRHRYNRHIKTHDKENAKYACNLCSKRLRTTSGLAHHIQGHTGERPCKCSHCSYTAPSDGHLKGHAERIHNIYLSTQGKAHKGKTCRTCNEHYGSYYEFVLHSMSHLRAVVVLKRLNFHVL